MLLAMNFDNLFSNFSTEILEIFRSISMYFSSIFSALTTAFRFMLESAGFVASLQTYVPTVIGISCTVIIAVSIVKAIFGR